MARKAKSKLETKEETISNQLAPKVETSISTADEDKISDSFEISTFGYKLLFKIIYDSQENGLIARYLKALNSYGETIYIYLDKPGYISTTGICHRAERSDLANQSFDKILDQEIKDILHDLNFDLFGIAIEHKNHLSILTRRTDKPQEFESRHMEVTFENPLTTFYPLVKLSEIEESSTAALKAGSESFRKIRNRLLSKATKDSLVAHNKIVEFHDKSAEFIRKSNEMTINLSRVIKELEDSCQNLQNKQITIGLSAKDEDRHELAIFNLINRHKLFERLLKYYQNFSNLSINDLEELKILITNMDKEFSAIDRIRYPGEIIV